MEFHRRSKGGMIMLRILGTIFFSFFKIGLFTLGGGLAIIPLVQQEMLARGWLTNAQFLDILGIAQMTPGPIGVNAATFVGYRVTALQGYSWGAAVLVSLVATFSVMLPSVVGVHFGGGWFERNRDRPWVKRVFALLRPLVAGFVSAAGVSLALEVFGAPSVHALSQLSPEPVPLAVFIVTVTLSLTKRFSPLWGLLLGACAGLLFY